MEQTKKLLTAKVISRVAEPIIWLPLMIWLVLKNIQLPEENRWLFYLLLLTFVFVIPFCYFMYLVYIKKEFDIDITQRNKRIGFTVKSMMSFAVALILTRYQSWELFKITLAVFLATASLILITLRWKISFHGGLNSLIFSTVNYLYHWRFWWLFLLLIPIGWSRLTMRKHNFSQFAAGVLVCTSIFFLVTGAL